MSAFGSRLRFGTAGLRGRIGPGPNQMNRALVRQVSYGLSQYLRNTTSLNKTDHLKNVVIGYDGRNQSWEFAQETASVY